MSSSAAADVKGNTTLSTNLYPLFPFVRWISRTDGSTASGLNDIIIGYLAPKDLAKWSKSEVKSTTLDYRHDIRAKALVSLDTSWKQIVELQRALLEFKDEKTLLPATHEKTARHLFEQHKILKYANEPRETQAGIDNPYLKYHTQTVVFTLSQLLTTQEIFDRLIHNIASDTMAFSPRDIEIRTLAAACSNETDYKPYSFIQDMQNMDDPKSKTPVTLLLYAALYGSMTDIESIASFFPAMVTKTSENLDDIYSYGSVLYTDGKNRVSTPKDKIASAKMRLLQVTTIGNYSHIDQKFINEDINKKVNALNMLPDCYVQYADFQKHNLLEHKDAPSVWSCFTCCFSPPTYSKVKILFIESLQKKILRILLDMQGIVAPEEIARHYHDAANHAVFAIAHIQNGVTATHRDQLLRKKVEVERYLAGSQMGNGMSVPLLPRP